MPKLKTKEPDVDVIDVVDAIAKLSDMKELKQVFNACKARWRQLEQRAARSFEYGDKVQFKTKYGQIVVGKVTNVNIKTISVQTPLGRYRVSPCLLTKVEE